MAPAQEHSQSWGITIRTPQILVTGGVLEDPAAARFSTSISGDLAVDTHAYRRILAGRPPILRWRGDETSEIRLRIGSRYVGLKHPPQPRVGFANMPPDHCHRHLSHQP
jgi:hypothetical protein